MNKPDRISIEINDFGMTSEYYYADEIDELLAPLKDCYKTEKEGGFKVDGSAVDWYKVNLHSCLQILAERLNW